MKKSLFSIVAIAVVAVVFVGGVVFGMLLQVQKDAPQIDKADSVLKILTSRVVPSIVVYGEISEIDGNKITISFSGDSATVKMRAGAAVSSFGGKVGDTPQTTTLNDVQAGQIVSISAKVLADGTVQGESLIILPGR